MKDDRLYLIHIAESIDKIIKTLAAKPCPLNLEP